MGNEWIIVLLVVLLLFGARKLPELASSMGRSIKEFRKATDEADREDSEQRSSTGKDSTTES